MNIIFVGTGSYICGKGSNEFGTILPAIVSYIKRYNKKIDIIYACNSIEGMKRARDQSLKLCKLISVTQMINFDYIMLNYF